MATDDTPSVTSKYLYRFDAPPVIVESQKDVSISSVSLRQFEALLRTCMDPRNPLPIHYMNRDDFSWLKCAKPLFLLETVLGMEEETDDPGMGHSHTLTIRTYSPSLADQTSTVKPTTGCYPGDGYTWKRETLTDISSPVITKTSKVLEWYDLRSDLNLPTMASRAHFLRSLLDVRHDASPWVPMELAPKISDDEDSKNVVVLMLSNDSPAVEQLQSFRVSDVAPSWFLHALVPLSQWDDSKLPWLRPSSSSIDNHDESKPILFIYRQLPPRQNLSVTHPVTNESVSFPGALWETLIDYTQADSGENHNQDDEPPKRYQQVAPPIVNAYHEYPNLLEPLFEHSSLDVIRQEALQIAHWAAWPEKQHYSSASDSDEAPWTVFPLCHTFPANDVNQKVWVPTTCAFVPETVKLLQEHLGDHLRTALFSRLEPESVLNAHTGWADLANHVVRLHMPLVLPPGDLCGVWVDGAIQLHEEGKPLCFDDSKTHRAYNYSAESRIVLIMDLARPPTMPEGSATGGHTGELDEFIKRMGVAR